MQRTMTIVGNIVILLTSYLTTPFAFSEEWQLEKSQKPIQVFSRDISNPQKKSLYKEILAVTTVKASPVALLNVLNDIKRAPQWIDNCIEVKIIANPEPQTKLVQSTFSAPWPLHKRDMLTKSITHFQDQQIVIDITDAGDTLPTEKNTVRMTDIQGRWTITPMTEGNIEIRYQGTGNPAGNIPIWLANKVLIDSTFITFKNLSSIITEEMYQHSEITH
ncbi:START domain-containing protein [Paraglaciecola hydrolytica]|uniref:START domain-containing protein n=1 Tax=Paraglaciecola hydrolytica TaxID=1799789 RepID=A0A136A0Z1_9ALTE|nr:START domain-containing protein [Paraglaciecola hydrolytica]KXI28894.1 hypothetical protein AX660_11935 [Paraglaciecola hydrolytica]